MLVLSGLKANWNYIHAGASGSFLTGTARGGRTEIEIVADTSMDQLLARHFARETQVASLELAMDPPANAGACSGQLSCVYTHTLSWRSPTQPLPRTPAPPVSGGLADGEIPESSIRAGQNAPAEQKLRVLISLEPASRGR